MAELAFILGESGTGKTYSLRNLDPEKTLVISVTPKSPTYENSYKKLSSKDKSGNYIVNDRVDKIIATISWCEANMGFETYVIDDFTYLQTYEFFDRVTQKGYDKYNEIGNAMYKLLSFLSSKVGENKVVFLLGHLDYDNIDGVRYKKIKTIGKMVDNLLKIEGLSNNILMSDVTRKDDKAEYYFLTQNDGQGIFKSSQLCGFDYKIPNDLELVRQKIVSTMIK